MSKVKIQGHASGTGVLTVTAPNTSTDRTITLPDGDVTLGGAVGGASGVDFNDDVKARFGTGNDLELYHNGSNSIIKNSTGITKIQADDIRIQSADDSESLAKFVKDGGAELYHNDSKKLETTATGIAVTGGVAIGGTGTANTLDDYEEGTWTPSIGGTATYTTQIGKYTKVGNMVTLVCEMNINNIGNAAIYGSLTTISGAPFTPITGSHAASGAVGYHANLAVNVLQLTWRMDGGNPAIHNAGLTSASGTMSAGLGVFGSGARILFGITYIAA